MLSRILYLSPDLLRRGWPFFLVYLALFSALTLADGLSLTLFVQRVGADALPIYQAVASVGVLLAVAWYLGNVERVCAGRLFVWILALPGTAVAAVWALVGWFELSGSWLGLLFVGRELGFALVLLHFGTYLQRYFSRDELSRAMPVIYAGGRFGGIAAGAVLEHLGGVWGPSRLLPLVLLLFALGGLGILWIQRRRVPRADLPGLSPGEPPRGADPSAVHSPQGFFRFVLANPLMFWISASTVAYFSCRTFLAFRYNTCFESSFASEAEMASFLGRYTQYALAASLVLQLLVINRWIDRVGLPAAQLTYAALLLAAALLGSLPVTLATAVFARLVEGELRYGLRNPISQLIVNQFSRALRIRARAWSLGLLIPLSTLASSLLLSALLQRGWVEIAAVLTGCLGCGYFVASLALAKQLTPTAARSPNPPAENALPSQV